MGSWGVRHLPLVLPFPSTQGGCFPDKISRPQQLPSQGVSKKANREWVAPLGATSTPSALPSGSPALGISGEGLLGPGQLGQGSLGNAGSLC